MDDSEISPLDNTPQPLSGFTKRRTIPSFATLEALLKRFSPGERFMLYIASVCLCFSVAVVLYFLNDAVSVRIPTTGGTLLEGETGPARFINPVLTLSQADQDLSALVFSGLVRALPNGTIVPDLASHYTISPDGTTYTFTLRNDAAFHDGTPLTSADIIFTVQLAQNPEIKSTHRADWEGVVVTAPDSHTVVFTLPRPYAPFIENATLGILPKHLWQSVSAEEFPFNPLNTHPIGSGPFQFQSLETDATGAATQYDLAPFSRYALGEPYLRHITFQFYADDAALINAFNTRQVNAIAGISSAALAQIKRTDSNIIESPLPRVFGVFFNQSHAPALADLAARTALDAAVDRQAIINSVLLGYGTPLTGPIPPEVTGTIVPAVSNPLDAPKTTGATTDATVLVQNAQTILKNGGWSFDEAAGVWKKGPLELSLSIATADSPELIATAQAVAGFWRAIGAKVAVEIYPLSELNTSVIRPRNYDAVLFGEVVGRDLDLYAFWGSKERTDPGLNLALYANAQADDLLTRARASADPEVRSELYTQFAGLIEKEHPAVFLYAPDFLYIIPRSLHGISLGALTAPAERFLGSYQWYTDTERIWSIFVPSQE